MVGKVDSRHHLRQRGVTVGRSPVATTGLTENQERAIEALIAAPTHREAAEAAGITTRALRYYLANPVFLSALRRRSSEHYATTGARMRVMAWEAAECLYREMNAPVPNMDRVAVASSVLSHAVKFAAADVEARLQELEERLGAGTGTVEVLAGPAPGPGEVDSGDGEDDA